MLILTRKPGQSIKIQLDRRVPEGTPIGALFADGPIEILVAKVNGRQVTLGIGAHPLFTILRDELCSD